MPDEYDELLNSLAPPAPRRSRPTTSRLNDLIGFAKENKLTVGSTTGGRHNAGSLHYSGNAIDIKGSGAFDDATVQRLSQAARERGFLLRDERRRPTGQKVWGGPHIHIEARQDKDDYDALLDSIVGRRGDSASTVTPPSPAVTEAVTTTVRAGGFPRGVTRGVATGRRELVGSQRRERVTSAITPLDEIPAVALPKPLDFVAGQGQRRSVSLNPVETVYDILSEPEPRVPGLAGLQARKYQAPPSREAGQRVRVPFAANRPPTNTEAVGAYLSSLGPEYVALGEKFQQETGQPILTLAGGVQQDTDGSFYLRPSRGSVEFINAYARGGLQAAIAEGEKQRQEQIAAQNAAIEAAKPQVAQARRAVEIEKASPAYRGLFTAGAGPVQAAGTMLGPFGESLRGGATEMRAVSEQAEKEKPLASLPTSEQVKYGAGAMVPTLGALLATRGLGQAQLPALGVLEGQSPQERIRGGLEGAVMQTAMGPVPAQLGESLPVRTQQVISGTGIGAIQAGQAVAQGEPVTSALIQNAPFAALPFLSRGQQRGVRGETKPRQGEAVPFEGRLARVPAESTISESGRVGVRAAEPVAIQRESVPATSREVRGERKVEMQPNVETASPQVGGAGATRQVAETGVSRTAGVQRDISAIESQPDVARVSGQTPVEPQPRWQHIKFGEVVQAGSQAGVGHGRVRVVAEDGTEHIIKRSNLRGQGNNLAVPIREQGGIPPESSAIPPRESAATPPIAEGVSQGAPSPTRPAIVPPREQPSNRPIQRSETAVKLPAMKAERLPKRVEVAGAVFDVVGRNPDGTLKLKSEGGEFDTAPGEKWIALPDSVAPQSRMIDTSKISREQFQREQVDQLQRLRRVAVTEAEHAVRKQWKPPKPLPVGIDKVSAFLVKPRYSPAEKKLKLALEHARSNLAADLRTDFEHAGRVWDEMQRRQAERSISASETAVESGAMPTPEYAAYVQKQGQGRTAFEKSLAEHPDRLNPRVYVPGKSGWEVTRSEWVGLQPPAYQERVTLGHRIAVEDALRRNAPVPPEVLADYPDLQPKKQPPAPKTTEGAARPKDEGSFIGTVSRQGAVEAQHDPNLEISHSDIGQGYGEQWRYLSKTKTVYWTEDVVPDAEYRHAVENYLDRRGYSVDSHSVFAKFPTVKEFATLSPTPERVSTPEAAAPSARDRLGNRSDYDRLYPPGSAKRAAYEAASKRAMDAKFQQKTVTPPPAPPKQSAPPVPPPPSKTSARKEMFKADRAELDLPELPVPERRKWQQTLAEAKAKGTADAALLADQVLRRPRSLNDTETAQIVLRAQEVKNRHAVVMKEIGEAKDAETIQSKRAEVEALEAEFDRLTTAAKVSGTEKGRALASQKLTINQDYDLVSLMQRAKAAKGRELKPEERQRYEQQAKRIAELESQLTAATERAANSRIQNEIGRIRRQTKRSETKAVLDAEFAVLKQQLSTAKLEVKESPVEYRQGGIGLASLDPSGKLTPIIIRMARNRAKAGVTSAEKLIDDVYYAVKSTYDVTRDDVADVIRHSLHESGDVLTRWDAARQKKLVEEIVATRTRTVEGDFAARKREPPIYNRETARLQRQIDEAKVAFNRELYRATRSVGGKISDELAKAANVPKTVKSIGDISAVFRQGGFYAVTHPVKGLAVPFRDMVRSFSDAGFRNVETAIKSHPKFEQSVKDGVEYTGVNKDDPRLSRREEGYLGGEYLDYIPVAKQIKDFSERTFVSFLDSQRINMYDTLTDGLANPTRLSRIMGARGGLSRADLQRDRQRIARAINSATGRGNLSAQGNQIAPALNIVMFSPRLLKSRVELLNNMFNPVAWKNMPRNARAQILQDNVKFIGATIGVLTLAKALGADVNYDPDDSEFLKIRAGNTTYDTLTGLQQPLRFLINMTRALSPVDSGRFQAGTNYTGKSVKEQIDPLEPGSFTRSKLSPAAGFAVDATTGIDFMGRKFEAKRAATDLVTPLPAADIIKAFQQDGIIGAVKSLPSLTGIGVGTYPPPPEKPQTHAEKMIRKINREAMRGRSAPRTEGQVEEDRQLSDLRARARKGENVAAQLNALQSSGVITEDQAEDILNAREETRLQSGFKRLSLRNGDALRVYAVMNADEKKSVREILERKAEKVDDLPLREQREIKQKLTAFGIPF